MGPIITRDTTRAAELLAALEAVRDGALEEGRASEYDVYVTNTEGAVEERVGHLKRSSRGGRKAAGKTQIRILDVHADGHAGAMTMHMTNGGAFLRREGPESEPATVDTVLYPGTFLGAVSHAVCDRSASPSGGPRRGCHVA